MSRREIVLKGRLNKLMGLFNKVMSPLNHEYTVDVCTDGYIHLIRCIYSPINSFPEVDALDTLCHGEDPSYMIFLPLEFALDRVYQECIRKVLQ